MISEKNLDLILPFIERPSRYCGTELNSHTPDMSQDFSVCLAFGDVYEVGTSNLGIEILYHLVNESKLARCERCFAPATDLEKILREKNIGLFSLESKSFLNTFDIVGFSLQSELAATNIVNMLDLSGISVFACGRKEGEPLIIGGGPVLTNPEPFADFFDLFVLGDGEEVLEEVIIKAKALKSQHTTRKNVLETLAQIQGVYVPSFYDATYNTDGTFDALTPNNPVASPKISKRVSDVNKLFFPAAKIVPFTETVHNRINIEVARGCPGRCRFCAASKYYRPWRQKEPQALLKLLDSNLQATGYNEISFSSLSSSDYKHLKMLLIETSTRYKAQKINISLPSLRCNAFSVAAAAYINGLKRPTLTLAPEAASQKLRNVIGKYLSDEEIINTLTFAHSLGWKVIKLYFMIGLPAETPEDILAIGRLIRNVKAQAKGLNFNITVSPFVPKAQTTFQWAQMAPQDDIKEKISILKKLPANIKAHNSASSLIEAFLARGDRRLARVIYKVWQKGARLDQWAEKFNFSLWQEAISESGLNLDFYVYRQRPENEKFPWEHLDFGVSKEDLYKDYLAGLKEAGLYDKSATNKNIPSPISGEPANFPQLPAAMPQKQAQPPKMKVRLRFARRGLVKYVSHLEQIEVLRRAIMRSGLPVCFSEGFSPQVKVSFGQAISVGYESETEIADLCLNAITPPEEIFKKINAALPKGYFLLSAKPIPLSFPSAESSCNAIEYEISGLNLSKSDIKKFLSNTQILITKQKKGKAVEIDAKPLIIKLESADTVRLILKSETGKTLKPESILKKLLENSENYGTILGIKRLNAFAIAHDGKMYEL
ncbi:MAG: TIGR03960 family B12-binding radical SAM protein [Elusimicrobia bacterium]|nr:TIGR03960 family B12-binding radical SAM protein [Elusimicrobiota bacterium]